MGIFFYKLGRFGQKLSNSFFDFFSDPVQKKGYVYDDWCYASFVFMQ